MASDDRTQQQLINSAGLMIAAAHLCETNDDDEQIVALAQTWLDQAGVTDISAEEMMAAGSSRVEADQDPSVQSIQCAIVDRFRAEFLN